MPKSLAALLKLGQGPIVRTFTEMASAGLIDKAFGLAHDLHHMHGIVFPVSCQVNHTTRLQFTRK